MQKALTPQHASANECCEEDAVEDAEKSDILLSSVDDGFATCD